MFAAMQLLRGSVYEQQDNWPLASRCYTAALRHEPLCYAALDRLVANHMLSTSEQRELLCELERKLEGTDAEWLQLYYRCKLDPEQGRQLAETYERSGSELAEPPPAEAPSPAVGDINENCDMLTAAAEYEYNHDHFRRCYKLSSRVLARD
eukprot:2615757-Prymnesium_polylepis.1